MDEQDYEIAMQVGGRVRLEEVIRYNMKVILHLLGLE